MRGLQPHRTVAVLGCQTVGMRIWLPMTGTELSAFAAGGPLPAVGVSVTPQWAAQMGESDGDVLEGLRLDSLDAQAVAVVEGPAEVVDPTDGVVRLGADRPSLMALFVADADGEFSWYGPTETAEAAQAALYWHSN